MKKYLSLLLITTILLPQMLFADHPLPLPEDIDSIPIHEPDYNTATASDLQRYKNLLEQYRDNEKTKDDVYTLKKKQNEDENSVVDLFSSQSGFDQEGFQQIPITARPDGLLSPPDTFSEETATLISIVGRTAKVFLNGVEHPLKIGDSLIGWTLSAIVNERSIRINKDEESLLLTLGVSEEL